VLPENFAAFALQETLNIFSSKATVNNGLELYPI